MMYYFPPISMLYRLGLTLGLLLLPVASAEAAYQQKYVLPDYNASSSASSVNSISTPSQNGSDPMMNPTVEVDDASAAMTRAEFTAELVRSIYTPMQIENCFWSIASSHPPRFTLVFTDVEVTDMYAKEICIAMRDGLVRGHGDGSFTPDRSISFAESAKILSRAFALAPYADADTKTVWYGQHVRALLVRNAVPVSITRLNQAVSTVEMRDMLERIQNDITWRPSQVESVLFPIFRPRVVPTPAPAPITGGNSSSSSDAMVQSSSSQKSAAVSSAMSEASTSSATSSKESFWDLF